VVLKGQCALQNKWAIHRVKDQRVHLGKNIQILANKKWVFIANLALRFIVGL
jgi:hypothetical protein